MKPSFGIIRRIRILAVLIKLYYYGVHRHNLGNILLTLIQGWDSATATVHKWLMDETFEVHPGHCLSYESIKLMCITETFDACYWISYLLDHMQCTPLLRYLYLERSYASGTLDSAERAPTRRVLTVTVVITYESSWGSLIQILQTLQKQTLSTLMCRYQ